MKGVDVATVRIIPEMVLYQYLDSNLSLRHAGIINDEGSFLLCFSLWENESKSEHLFGEDVIQ